MTYADYLDQPAVESNFLIVLKPRRRVNGFLFFAGAVYSAPYDFPVVTNVQNNGVELAPGTSSALAADQFYHDAAAGVLYVRLSSGLPNENGRFIVAFYELYLATTALYAPQVPTDSASATQWYEALVKRAPSVKNSLAEVAFGLIPSQTTAVSFINNEHFFERHLYDSSFSKADITIYHALGPINPANTALFYQATVTGVDYDGESVNMNLTDKIDTFDLDFRNKIDARIDYASDPQDFYSIAKFPLVDPNFVGRPIRRVFGHVDGHRLTNIDYDAVGSLTTNRKWVASARLDGIQLGAVTNATPAVYAFNTLTRTYLSSFRFVEIGQPLHVSYGGAAHPDAWPICTSFGSDVHGTYVNHSALGFVINPGAGDQIAWYTLTRVFLLKDSLLYELLLGKHWGPGAGATETNYDVGTVQLVNSFEVGFIPANKPVNPGDTLFCSFQHAAQVQLSAVDRYPTSPLDVSVTTNHIAHLAVMLKKAGIPESKIDIAAFTALQTGTGIGNVGFVVPPESSGGFPSLKAVIGQLLATGLVRLYLNNANVWTVTQIKPIGATAADGIVSEDDIINRGVRYNFRYLDLLSDIIVSYGHQEVPTKKDSFGTVVLGVSADSALYARSSSSIAQYIHQVTKEKTFPSLHSDSASALKLADRLSYIFGERQGDISVQTRHALRLLLLGNLIEVDSTRMPGFAFGPNTSHARKFAIQETSKALTGVTFDMNDQKGIEDNLASW